ncbi:hypothetical protein CMV_015571 [Castanea mollissima]|uniref:Cyclin C-terminal domain-containing protein n=1 Tax=Castanea mollissima TaxID=60419 RepID=A0A8J4VJX3_9ROSI|nr:hypothetical protein CMV_015571 [Castanea mollissima]
MEKAILEKLEWYLTVPTPYVFLVRYVKASVAPDLEMENMVYFLAELGQQIIDCAKLLVEFHSAAAEGELKVVYGKYS